MAAKIIDPADYPSNSKSAREPKKAVTKAVVVEKQKPLLARIFGDNLQQVGSYIIWDVLIPAAKATISDIINNGSDMILFGEGGRGRSNRLRRDRDRTYVNYHGAYDRDRLERRDIPRVSRNRHMFDDVVIDTKGEAEAVLTVLIEAIDMYGTCTVAEFYEAVQMPIDYTDHKWGWHNLTSAYVQRNRFGYILVLPQPEPLD